MIDLHTHILPEWDDGAKDWEEAYRMAEIAAKDGVETIVMTPHIIRINKHAEDFEWLARKFAEAEGRLADTGVKFLRGAEVYIRHDIVQMVRAHGLTVNGSSYVFIEFPADYVPPGVKELVYQMMLEGLTPIISHPERNLGFAGHPDSLYELVRMGCLGQVTAKSLSGEFGAETKKAADLFLKHNLVHVIASDAHDTERRPPVLSKGVDEAAKIVGREKAEAMVREIPRAILDDEGTPDWGEPENPTKPKKKLAFKVPWGRRGDGN